MKKKTTKTNKTRGPKMEHLKADGVDWKDALRHALNKPKPKDGWPKPEKKTPQNG